MFKEIQKKLKKTPKGSIDKTSRTYAEVSVHISFEDSKGNTISHSYNTGIYRFAGKLVCKSMSSSLLKAKTRLDLEQEDLDYVKSVVTDYDAVDIWETCLPEIEEKLYTVSPTNYMLWKDCLWEQADESDGIATLAVGYDKSINKFVFYYNPDFILEACAVQYYYDGKKYKSFEDCYFYNTLFMIVHEMSHITRSHLQNTDKTMLDGVSPRDVNIYGDSYINMSIPGILEPLAGGKKREMLVIGITEELIKSGTTKGLDSNGVAKLMKDFLRMLSIKNTAEFDIVVENSLPIPEGASAIVKLEFANSPQELGIENSNLFIKACNFLFDTLISPRKAAPQMQQGDSNQQGGSGQQGGEQQDQQDNGGQKGDKSDQKADSNQSGDDNQKGSNNSNSKKSEIQEQQDHIEDQQRKATEKKNESEQQAEEDSDDVGDNSKQVEDQIKNAVNKAMAEAKRRLKKEGKDNEESLEDMQAKIEKELGQSLRSMGIASSSTLGSWKVQLRKLVANATGIKEVWDANTPNARIQGQFGREIEVPTVKSVILMFDRSGSMSMEKFKEVLQETLTMFSNLNTTGMVVHVVYWGETGKQMYKRFKYSKDLVDKIKAASPQYGSNDLQDALRFTKDNVKRADLVMVFSDYKYVIYEPIATDVAQYYRRIKKQTIFVSTKDGKVDELLELDPTARNKFIKPR